ncbi:MAG: hypothetical protein KDA86_09650 [Planctomycetaceae bacterium]|nr:hypothetical protein [Planctomycetaceae bacterium]
MDESPQTIAHELSLHDMLRVMDIARALRKEQETVEREFNRVETSALLRDKLLASAETMGSIVTPDEVDAAIELYFDNLHTFHEPPPGLSRWLAHAYIWRGRIALTACVLLFFGLSGWWLLVSPSGPFSSAGRTSRAIAADSSEIERAMASIRAMSKQAQVQEEIQSLEQEAQVAQAAGDVDRLDELRRRLTQIEARLQEEYELRIVSGEGQQSGVDRYFTDEQGTRTSGYYVIVQAKSASGEVLTRNILNSETGREDRVSVWAERVPEAVYNRIRDDKQADGILNETLFAVKRRGEVEEQIVFAGDDGMPLTRDAQITRW